jgi:RNA polymerase sigma-70 factor, ECF subfamily
LIGDPNIKLLIEQIKCSNEAAEFKLFRQYFPYIKSICNRYSSDDEESKEMVNDTFLKVFRHIDKYDPEFEFKPWIRKICINCCTSYNKKYFNNQKTLALEFVSDADNGEYENMTDAFSPNDCLAFIANLSPQYRTVFNLFVFEDLKHHEIAQELNISVGTCKSNLSRAKAQLIEEMKQKKPELFNKKIALNG